MSTAALRDLSISDRNIENSSKQRFITKPCFGATTGNGDDCQQKNSATVVPACVNGSDSTNNDGEVISIEVEYIEAENLSDVEDLDLSLKTILSGLDSKDWVFVCESLNNLRRLSIFHRDALLHMLGDVIPLVVKSVKNPRSALIKTTLMACADIFQAFGDHVIGFLDPLLVQLLLKSSQDKKFVCEAAEKALVAMTTWVSPALLIPKLQPNLKHRNPRIRAKASMCFCRSVPRLGVDGIKAYGIDKLIQVAASQLSDQLPESREAARTLVLELQSVYEKFPDITKDEITEQPGTCSWENFCLSKLSRLSAQAVLRVTNINKEGPILENIERFLELRVSFFTFAGVFFYVY
ncbi:hypothetical protein ACFE04_005217 [Oxalis oulophora]